MASRYTTEFARAEGPGVSLYRKHQKKTRKPRKHPKTPQKHRKHSRKHQKTLPNHRRDES